MIDKIYIIVNIIIYIMIFNAAIKCFKNKVYIKKDIFESVVFLIISVFCIIVSIIKLILTIK